jgi:hypothetical protein
MRAKFIFVIAGIVLFALFAGWMWGAWGQSEGARALQAAELRGELLGARAAVLDARVAIYSVNFGEASKHLENAEGLLRRADGRLKSLDRDEDVKTVETALATVADAQRMAGQLDQNANSRAGEAAKLIASLLATEAR